MATGSCDPVSRRLPGQHVPQIWRMPSTPDPDTFEKYRDTRPISIAIFWQKYALLLAESTIYTTHSYHDIRIGKDGPSSNQLVAKAGDLKSARTACGWTLSCSEFKVVRTAWSAGMLSLGDQIQEPSWGRQKRENPFSSPSGPPF